MNQKELRNIAKKIAAAEKVIQDESADKVAKKNAEETIFLLSGKVTSLADMCELDELVQDMLNS